MNLKRNVKTQGAMSKKKKKGIIAMKGSKIRSSIGAHESNLGHQEDEVVVKLEAVYL